MLTKSGPRPGFLSNFYLKIIILPRQARDKHRESTQKKCRFPSDSKLLVRLRRLGQHRCETKRSFFECCLSLCLSRACLGKKMRFYIKMAKNERNRLRYSVSLCRKDVICPDRLGTDVMKCLRNKGAFRSRRRHDGTGDRGLALARASVTARAVGKAGSSRGGILRWISHGKRPRLRSLSGQVQHVACESVRRARRGCRSSRAGPHRHADRGGRARAAQGDGATVCRDGERAGRSR